MKRRITDLKVAELKLELEKRGLESKGLKGALVQRLQKAIEDDGGNSSEIEFATESASPKPRRGSSRPRRTPEADNEVAQDPEIEKGEAEIPHESEKSGGNTAKNEEPSEENAPETDEVEAQNEVQNGNESDEVPETEVQAAEEDEAADDQLLEDGQDDQNDEEDPVNEQLLTDDLPVDENGEEVYADGKDNDYRAEEESASEPVEQEEEEVIQEEDGGEEVVEQEEVVDGGEVAEAEESAEAAESSVEEVEEMVTETAEEVGVDALEQSEQPENGQTRISTEAASGTVDSSKNAEEKPKTDAAGKEEVSVPEDDVLDMLDYDIEIGDQNNINVQSDDQSSKASSRGAGTHRRTAGKAGSESEKDAKPNAAPTAEKKTRSATDSSKKPATPASGSDASKSGGQSTAKSSSGVTKEGGKSTSGGKRDGASSSGKKDDGLNKNLWISGLSSTTRASELKSAFSRYGKVIGAKVVTNVKSPGSRCYGYVTMATADAASKCILHLNNTEMHGRMITVEIAKGDPSASSKKQQSASGSGSAKKDAESKDGGTKGKEGDSKQSTATGRRPSSSALQASKSEKESAESKDKNDGDKKSQPEQGKDISATTRKTSDDGKKKSPARARTERTASAGGPRSGDKRHNRSPGVRNRSASKTGHGKDEPERKRPRQPEGDRKVVMDSHKGELRVNVSGTNRMNDRTARWPNDNRPKPLVTRRRSLSPVRRRELSPVRGQVLARVGAGGRDFKPRPGRGRGGMLTSRNATGRGGARGGQILSFNQIRAQQRDRERPRMQDRGRGGLSAAGQLHAERDRLRREREEREKLRLERERLERERRQLEKDRQERERLEQERLRLEQERKRELERIEREKAEMRRLQEITRYEVEQRQRAIKRTYDDDGGGHRGGRSSRDTYDSKRAMMSDRDSRGDGRRGERDDRRGYDSYNSRDAPRNGPAPSPGYRTSQGSYRGSGDGAGAGRSKASAYESRRGAPAQSDPHHDSDARYGGGGSGGAAGRSGGRNMEKYERRDANRTIDYSHGFDRESASDSRRVETSPPRRRQQPREAADHRDGRKVVRERADHRGSGTSPEFRRTGRSGNARVEITREQSPPARRGRRGSTSPVPARGAAWRDTKGSSSRGPREDDRDLREQIRGRQSSASGSYGESGRERAPRRTAGSGDSSSPSPVRTSGQYQTRWPENATDGSSQQLYAASGSAGAIAATARSGGTAASWQHMQSWPQGAAQSARAGWPGTAIQSTTSPVGRQLMAAAYGGSATTILAPPGTTINPTAQSYIPTTDRTSRSFQAPYKQITRRY